MAKSKPAPKRAPETQTQSKEITGTYAYDAKLGRVVKVSDKIPGVASHGSKDAPCGANLSEGLPCGQGECSGGSCSMGGDLD